MSSADSASPWIAPELGGSTGPMTANKLEALQRAAYDEAFASGCEEGRQAGRQDLAELTSQLSALVGSLSEPFRQLDEEVDRALVDLAVRVARQIIRRELKTDPTHVVGVLHEAIKLLPVGSRSVTVHLHPEDAAVVRHAYGEANTELAWKLVEDPVVSRGGLQVITETSQIDARLERRLETILANVVDGERESDA